MNNIRKKFLIAILFITVITITGCKKNISPLKSSDLSIKDFKYETSLKKYSGYDCYALTFTNNSNYDVIGVKFSYKVKNDISQTQLKVYDKFMKSHDDYIKNDDSASNVTLIGNKNQMIGKGETIEDILFAVGFGNLSWYDVPTPEQFNLMEPKELQLGIIGKDKNLYIAYYDFINESWTLDEKTVVVDTWSKTEIAKKIESPNSKHNVIITDKKGEFEFTSYGVTKDAYEKYIEKVKSLGFIDESPTSTNYYAQTNDGYSINITYNEEDLILEVDLEKE